MEANTGLPLMLLLFCGTVKMAPCPVAAAFGRPYLQRHTRKHIGRTMDSCERKPSGVPWGVCVLGSTHLTGHVATLTRDPRFRLVAVAGQMAGAPNAGAGVLRQYPDADAAFHDVDVDGVIINTPVEHRAHWARSAIEAGKPALCELPLVSSTAQARELREACVRSATQLTMVSCVAGRDLDRAIRGALGAGGIGVPLYFDLRVAVPRTWLVGAREGVLLLHGYPFARVLAERFGPLDTVLARTRSLARNHPTEDASVMMLRFISGIEGVLQVDGLGPQAQAHMTLHGTTGSVCLRSEIETGEQRDLRVSYDDFASVLGNVSKPAHGIEELTHTMYTLDWIRQSARQNVELYRRDVRTS